MTIRYLHVIPSLNPEFGGPAEGVRQLAAAARRLNHNVEIATLDPGDRALTQEIGCPVHYVGPAYLKYRYAPRYVEWLRRNLHRFDAVVVNGIWQFHSFETWRLLRNHPQVPYYVFTHGMLDPWFKHRYPLKHLKKLLYWPWAEYRVLRDARAVLFTCEEERLLARQTFGLYSAKEIVVSHGAPAMTGNPAAQREIFLQHFPRLRGKRLILFLSRIHPKKGCDLLLDAFAELTGTDASLRLVMAGPDQVGAQAQLVLRAERLGIGGLVTWTGMLRGDLKAGAFRTAEAFILPSHQENFGIAVVEALACGVPALISNKVNIWREIQADHAGLVAEDTMAGTKELLARWLALTVSERDSMTRNALRCFERRFHIDIAANNILGALERGIGGPRQTVAA
jgi:glycosyltransferase involved in cell wall biosynthesis